MGRMSGGRSPAAARRILNHAPQPEKALRCGVFFADLHKPGAVSLAGMPLDRSARRVYNKSGEVYAPNGKNGV